MNNIQNKTKKLATHNYFPHIVNRKKLILFHFTCNSYFYMVKHNTSLIQEWDKSDKKSSIGVIDNLDVDIRTPIQKNVDTSMRMIETLDNRELSEELANYANENIIEEKTMLIEVNRNSNLLVTPGTIHRIVFDVMNSCILPVRYVFRVKSTPFRLYNIQPA